MSAFVVDHERVGYLAWVLSHEIGEGFRERVNGKDVPPPTLSQIARVLAFTNLESVGWRYQITVDEAAQFASYNDCFHYASQVMRSTRRRFAEAEERGESPSPSIVRKILDQYQYQACEAPDWLDGRARKWLEHLEAHPMLDGPMTESA